MRFAAHARGTSSLRGSVRRVTARTGACWPYDSLPNTVLTRSAQTSLRPLLPPSARARKQLRHKQQLNGIIRAARYLPGRWLGDAGHVDPVHIELREPGVAPVRLRARLAGRVRAWVHHQGRRPVRMRGLEAPPDASLPRHAPGIPRGGAARARCARSRCE